MSSDPSEQLHYLACLISWLAGISGQVQGSPEDVWFPMGGHILVIVHVQVIEAPDQYDDPNTIAANIIHTIKKVRL